MALVQVTIATITVAVAVCALLSLANWLLVPAHEDEVVPRGRRCLGYVLIGLMALIILAGLYLIVHHHVERLLGLA